MSRSTLAVLFGSMLVLGTSLDARAAEPSPSERYSGVPADGSWTTDHVGSAPSAGDRPSERRRRSASEQWMASLEGVTHAPIDVGVMVGFEAPFRVRLSGGYGWVPDAYLNLVTHAALGASGGDATVESLIENGFQGGHVWRVQTGIRPFSQLGLYLDVGYAHLNLDGSLDSRLVPESVTLGMRGAYRVSTSLDLWLAELGWQSHLGSHVVLGVGAGVMGTFNARTTVAVEPGSRNLPTIGAQYTDQVDRQLERHGYVPTLTLRLGYDFI